MRESTFGQLLTEKFFPAWLDTLHFWLVQPNYSAGEVASWCVTGDLNYEYPVTDGHFFYIGTTTGKTTWPISLLLATRS